METNIARPRVEILTDLDEEAATPPAEEVLMVGSGEGRAMTVHRWTAACLALVAGFALGRLPGDRPNSSSTQQAVPVTASPSITAHWDSPGSTNQWDRPGTDGGYACLRDTGGAGGQCNIAMGIERPSRAIPAPAGATPRAVPGRRSPDRSGIEKRRFLIGS